jgi:hypothetical protein
VLDFHLRRSADHDGASRRSEAMFHRFRLEDQIPETHLLWLIDQHVSFEFVRQQQLTMQAVDVSDDRVLWQETKNVPAEDRVAMRDHVTSKVRQGMIPALGASTTAGENGTHPTSTAGENGTHPTSEEAYELSADRESFGNVPTRRALRACLTSFVCSVTSAGAQRQPKLSLNGPRPDGG